MVTHESLTKRIKVAKTNRDKPEVIPHMKRFWIGYIQACRDIRNNVNSGK